MYLKHCGLFCAKFLKYLFKFGIAKIINNFYNINTNVVNVQFPLSLGSVFRKSVVTFGLLCQTQNYKNCIFICKPGYRYSSCIAVGLYLQNFSMYNSLILTQTLSK